MEPLLPYPKPRNFSNQKQKKPKVENIYKFSRSKEKKANVPILGKLHPNSLYQTSPNNFDGREKGEVLFMIKFNVFDKNIIIKYFDTSNAFQLSEKIAVKYKLSDSKREEVYRLILTRLKQYEQMTKNSPIQAMQNSPIQESTGK